MKKNATPRGKGSAKSSKAKAKPTPKKPANSNLAISKITKKQTHLITGEEDTTQFTPPQFAARKAAFISAMVQSLGVASKASLKTGIPLRTHRQWMADDEAYRATVTELKEISLDFYEEALHDLVKQRNAAAVIFALKTQGKRRGYIETVHQVTQTFDDNNVTVFELPDNKRGQIPEATIVNE